MADENVTNVENVESTGETVVTPAEKKFTQAELDKIVKERLEREKNSFKAQKDSYETDKSNLQASIDSYESKLKELIQPSLENIPEEYKELVEKLPLLEQVAFINKLSGKDTKESKRFIPRTPTSSESEKKQTQRPVGTIV